MARKLATLIEDTRDVWGWAAFAWTLGGGWRGALRRVRGDQ